MTFNGIKCLILGHTDEILCNYLDDLRYLGTLYGCSRCGRVRFGKNDGYKYNPDNTILMAKDLKECQRHHKEE